jgi:chemotaxis protein methyltransferase CheR
VAIAESELQLTERELARIIKLVHERSGITLHEGKRPLILARLHKRLRVHAMTSFSAYLAYIEADRSGDEMVALLDAIATNHTYFFREEQHFQLLTSRVISEWRARGSSGPFRLWSAACSSGEEPYTIAMALSDLPSPIDFGLLASDMSTKVLAMAKAGVYKCTALEAVPKDVLRRHFERGLGAQDGLARVAPAIRRRVAFKNLNLLEINDLGERFDTIFCRNVMIYFDHSVQQRVVTMLERHLKPHGYLFISHSESLNGLTHGLQWVAPAVYARRG